MKSQRLSATVETLLSTAVLTAPAPPLVVAFSGGLDSTVLLHALASDSRARALGLRAVHVHHGWSPLADDWAAHCARFAAALQINLQVLRVRMDRSDGCGPEAQARRARYRALGQILTPQERLLTAHHADDQMETVLLKLLRGSGLDGLGGMRARARVLGVPVWRPLLTVPRAELLAYAQRHELRWLDDPSNADQQLARGWLRAQVLPVLLKRLPQLSLTLGHSARHLQADARLLQQLTEQALARCRLLDPLALDITALLAQPVDLQLRVLRAWLFALQLPAPPVQLLERLLADLPRLGADREPLWQSGDLRLQRYREVLYVVQQPPLPSNWSMEWDGAAMQLPLGLGHVQWSAPITHATGSRWQLRARRGGEQLQVRGMHRPLKKLLQELAVPPWERSRLVLLFELLPDGSEHLRAVLGVQLDDELRARLAVSGARLLWQSALEHGGA